MAGRSLSVVIPVYKVDTDHLRECLDSVISQTFTDFELIIVIDGAPDDVCSFIDSYDFRGADVKIIRQENMGVAAARNTGIDAATGKYITFIDSDDSVTQDMFKDVVSYAQQNGLEVLMWGIERVYPDHTEEFSPYVCDIPKFSAQQLEEVQLKCLVGILPFYVCPPAGKDAAGAACAKLYDLDFLKRKNLRYTPGLKKSEDMLFNLRVFDEAGSVGSLHRFYYRYRIYDSSATYCFRENSLDLMTPVLEGIRRLFEEKNKSDRFFQVYYMRCMFFYLESMDTEYLNPANKKPFKERKRALAGKAEEEPYAEAFKNLRGDHLTFARKIPLFLIRHKMFAVLMLFFATYRKMTGN